MELWFVFAVLSSFGAGAVSFLYKMAAAEDYDLVVMILSASIFSLFFSGIGVYLTSGFGSLWHYAFFIAIVAEAAYQSSAYMKVRALTYMDAALFFPLYKIAGPLLVVLYGVVLFGERFDHNELIGIGLSLVIPLLLISRAESDRQYDLRRGLLWLLLITIATAVGISLWKYGVDVSPSVWTFLFSLDLAGIFISVFILLRDRRKRSIWERVSSIRNASFGKVCFWHGIASLCASFPIALAFYYGGPLGIVYTIGSLYILIPIVLSIIFYKEHWNFRKIIAIALSILVLGFFGR